MLAYIIRRVLYMIPILMGIALITFLLFNIVGGDPVLIMLGKHATPQTIADLRYELGLDRPVVYQFFDFLKQIATFDFGRSYSTKQEISSMMIRAAPVSLSLAFPAFFVSILIAISLSLLVAFKRGTWVDKLIVITCVVMLSVPSLAYILFGQYFFAFKWELFPISGYSTSFPEIISYLALPFFISIALSLGGEIRFYRTVMLDEINQDYIRTARSKGLTERVVMFKHLLKNSMIPIITNIVIELPFLILGALLLENFFGIPGMGSMIVDALNTSDLPVIKAAVVVLSVLYMVFDLISDICYALVDPRISLK
jgi:peptide/nickel transport system permease protein